MAQQFLEMFWKQLNNSPHIPYFVNKNDIEEQIEKGNYTINYEEGILKLGEYTESKYNTIVKDLEFNIKCVTCGTYNKQISYHWCYNCFSKWHDGDKSIVRKAMNKNDASDFDFLPSSDDEN